MLRLRLLLVTCASTLALAALAITLISRGEDDSSEDSATVLADYFTAMAAINDKSDRQFEDTVFGVEQESAQSYAEAFDSVLAMLESEYERVSPPSAIEDEHEALILAIQDYRVGIDHGLRPLDPDAPAAEFETLFSGILADEDLRISSAFCKIQKFAAAEGIKAEVGCQQT